jgi:hypothetical protein
VLEIRTLRVMWRGLETELRRYLGATAPVPDPTSGVTGCWSRKCSLLGGLAFACSLHWAHPVLSFECAEEFFKARLASGLSHLRLT